MEHQMLQIITEIAQSEEVEQNPNLNTNCLIVKARRVIISPRHVMLHGPLPLHICARATHVVVKTRTNV